MTDDGMTAWQRAGGFPREEWHAVLMWAVGKNITAELARAAYSAIEQDQEGDLAKAREKADRLKAEDEMWDRRWRGAMAGDPKIFMEVHGMWTRETGGEL